MNKCKDCKYYRPEQKIEEVSKVKKDVFGRGRYVTVKVYKRCAIRFESHGYMSSCSGNHTYCFEKK